MSYAEARNRLREVDSVSKQDREWITDRSFRQHVGIE